MPPARLSFSNETSSTTFLHSSSGTSDSSSKVPETSTPTPTPRTTTTRTTTTRRKSAASARTDSSAPLPSRSSTAMIPSSSTSSSQHRQQQSLQSQHQEQPPTTGAGAGPGGEEEAAPARPMPRNRRASFRLRPKKRTSLLSHGLGGLDDEDDESIRSFGTIHTGAANGIPREIETEPDNPTIGEFFQATINTGGSGDDVACFKFIVFTILVMSALLIGNAAFVFTTLILTEDYETKFESYASELIQGAQQRVEVVFSSTKVLGDHVIGLCRETNCSWPYVTLSSFEARHQQFLNTHGADWILFLPTVHTDQREEWVDYSIKHQGWLNESYEFRRKTSADNVFADSEQQEGVTQPLTAPPIVQYLHKIAPNEEGDYDVIPGPVEGNDFYSVLWQVAPALHTEVRGLINIDGMYNPAYASAYKLTEKIRSGVMSAPFNQTRRLPEPSVCIVQPITRDFDSSRSELVGTLSPFFNLSSFFLNLLPAGVNDLVVIMTNQCDDVFSFKVNNGQLNFTGFTDDHDINYEDIAINGRLITNDSSIVNEQHVVDGVDCPMEIYVYPTEEFRKSYQDDLPLIYTTIVLGVMCVTICLFCIYDFCVEKRQETIAITAAKSNALVSSLFPEQVKEKLLVNQQQPTSIYQAGREYFQGGGAGGGGGGGGLGDNHTNHNPNDPNAPYYDTSIRPKFLDSKPIAELFPETTIMFADIVGFTAWSSVREPAQVFTLLETIYNAFDAIAKRRGVFKVETIGDCYVAVAGLPEPRPDHAVAMARFAYTCIRKMDDTVKDLELTLGPDTAELTVRVGLHSGPVTGGVLRGEKSRFQLFGDTVNTASRIESTGESRMVHMSQDTATLLKKAGKNAWVKKREEKVVAKGKGELQTYWLDFRNSGASMPATDSTTTPHEQDYEHGDLEHNNDDPHHGHNLGGVGSSHHSNGTNAHIERLTYKIDSKTRRLVEWMVQMLMRSLKQIVAMRSQHYEKAGRRHSLMSDPPPGGTVLDEVQEIIFLPTIAANYNRDPESVSVDPEVEALLYDYVTRVSTMYRDNFFHNFEHASHVTMSVTKLLSRIVSPHDIDYSEMTYKQKKSHSKLHQQTYGITSDPLTQFAITFSALIHDVDHVGVPNAQLVKERTPLARLYKNKSVAEQNSVDIAWGLLMDPRYTKLVKCICITRNEQTRFRQLVVNAVMATDIVDKELGALRRERWVKAFSDAHRDEDPRDTVNRKATIVIEHLIQASDVAHTMQHWHVYQKWNEKFFRECYKAYIDGRSEKDPSLGWYQGEINFFDFYIIPLANKLRECGLFGVSSDEYLDYAQANRQEWEKKGEEVVLKYLEKAKRDVGIKEGEEVDVDGDDEGKDDEGEGQNSQEC